MPWASMAAWCSGFARTPRSPPWTAGCKVLTRPSIISGNFVRSEISCTGSPASASALCVPPVETRAIPRSLKPRAKSTRPVLSDTERSARVTGFRSLGMVRLRSAGGACAIARTRAGAARVQGPTVWTRLADRSLRSGPALQAPGHGGGLSGLHGQDDLLRPTGAVAGGEEHALFQARLRSGVEPPGLAVRQHE